MLGLFFDQKLHFTYIQATGEAFSPQKKTSGTCKKWNLLLFFYVCGSFLPSWIRIRIQGPHWIRIHSTAPVCRCTSSWSRRGTSAWPPGSSPPPWSSSVTPSSSSMPRRLTRSHHMQGFIKSIFQYSVCFWTYWIRICYFFGRIHILP